MSWIEDLVKKYKVDADRLDLSMEGATKEEILRLQELAGKELPSDYLDYLASMGKCDGGILKHIPAHTDIVNLLSVYEEISEFPDDFPKGDWVLIGAGYNGVNLLLNVKTGIVNDHSYDDEGIYLADSFPVFVEQQVFLRFNVLIDLNFCEFSLSSKDVSEMLNIHSQNELLKFAEFKFRRYSSIIESISDSRKVLSKGKDFYGYAEITPQQGVVFCVAGRKAKVFISELGGLFGQA